MNLKNEKTQPNSEPILYDIDNLRKKYQELLQLKE
jgi:hypothetical protein